MSFQLPADTDLSSPQIKLLKDWNEGLVEMNVESIGNHLHKDFHRSVYPRSIGQPEQNKVEWLKELTTIIGFATGFDVGHTPCHSNLLPPAKPAPQTTVHSIIEAPGRLVVHVRIPFLPG